MRPGVRRAGDYCFAENPALDAMSARILWHADLDPGTLHAVAEPTLPDDLDALDPARLAPWLTLVVDRDGEHAVLSDGLHHIRIDIAQGSLAGGAVRLHYRLFGLATANAKLLPLKRLIDLSQRQRFQAGLYPSDRRIARGLVALRIHDALRDGASQREIARVIFGDPGDDAAHRADSLRSRVRRLVREARALARGGYRYLMLRQTTSVTARRK